MRNMYEEQKWTSHPIIGYVPLDENDKPYQPILGRRHHARKKPVTIYTTLARAASYSPVKRATEVRMFIPIEMDTQS